MLPITAYFKQHRFNMRNGFPKPRIWYTFPLFRYTFKPAFRQTVGFCLFFVVLKIYVHHHSPKGSISNAHTRNKRGHQPSICFSSFLKRPIYPMNALHFQASYSSFSGAWGAYPRMDEGVHN
jgi:hypothetical protein